MDIIEAQQILLKNGFLLESSVKGDFVKGEKGGESYFSLDNDYTYDQARRWFVEAIYGPNLSDEKVEIYWENYLKSDRKKQFNRTYEQFEAYKSHEKEIKLYRGLVLTNGNELDMNKPGECWSFSVKTAKTWAENIWDKMVSNHTVDISELQNCKKIVFEATTSLDNCRLPYSIWLAGRFERPEWEIRIKDESLVKILKTKELD